MYRDLNALSSIVEICADGQYRLISSRPLNIGVGLHQPLADLLSADTWFPERPDEFWQKLEMRVAANHIQVHPVSAEHSVKVDLQRYLHLIEKAIHKNSVCQIVYKNKTRIIHPYKLTN